MPLLPSSKVVCLPLLVLCGRPLEDNYCIVLLLCGSYALPITLVGYAIVSRGHRWPLSFQLMLGLYSLCHGRPRTMSFLVSMSTMSKTTWVVFPSTLMSSGSISRLTHCV